MKLLSQAHTMFAKRHIKRARRSNGLDADRSYLAAYKACESALKIDPQKDEAYTVWASAYYYAAQNKSNKEQQKLFRDASEKCSSAFAINPQKADTLKIWGMSLAQLAKSESDSKAGDLYKQAHDKFAQAATLNANDAETLHQWGLSLYNQARTKSGAEATQLANKACEKFSSALAINNKFHEAFNDWGATLVYLASLQPTEEERAECYGQAQEKFQKADLLYRGISSYNMACVYSLLGDYEQCRQALEAARDYEVLPALDYINDDSDLDNVRATDWYQKFIEELVGSGIQAG